jgi:phenylacetate-CoA ligase
MITRVVWYWLQLRHNQWLPRKKLDQLQFKKLKAIVSHAYEKVPFYRRLYNEHGVRPDILRTLDDIRKFPILSKELVRDVPLEDRTAAGVDVSRCTLRTTSGSTGIPVKILEDERSIDYLDAYHLRRLREYGYRPWHKIIRLTTEPPRRESLGATGDARAGLMKRLRENRMKRLVVADDVDKHLEIIVRERPKLIVASPSYFRVLAKTMRDRGISGVRPRVLITWGEVLDEGTRAYISSSFGSEVYDGYGCTEAAPLGLAWECKERAGLHINMDVVLLEVLKNGKPVQPGERGEVYVTSLFRTATPMIRYRLGDIVTLSDEVCPCGREMPLIKNIEGRLVDFLRMPDGRMVSPYAVMSAVEGIAGIAKYQFIQESPDRIVVTVERGRDFDPNTITQLKSACHELFSRDLELNVKEVESFPLVRGRKFRPVESQIHIPQ